MKGRFVFSTQEVLEVVEVAEAETAKRKTLEGPHKYKAEEMNGHEVEEVLGNPPSKSDHDCSVVAMHR